MKKSLMLMWVFKESLVIVADSAYTLNVVGNVMTWKVSSFISL